MNNVRTITSETLADDELIARILQGEKELYATIVRRYNQRLYRIGISILNNEDEIEDAMQVAYINAWENLGKFQFKASFATWLTRILINECLLRLRKKRNFISMENVQQQNDTAASAADKLVNTELKAMLTNAILQLPETYRTVFVMREMENMNVAETSDCLAISEVNVKVRLNRAKAMLRDMLSAQYKREDILHFHLTRCDRVVEKVMKELG
ncbi:MAG TPA: sigma-70 family RNA polymerase sigma factor [Chitinophagaceae bacterium]